MRRTIIGLFLGLSWAASGGAQTAPLAGVIAADSAHIAGWYRFGPQHAVLVVWGPTGGYRLLDFDSLHFHVMTRESPNRYRLGGSGDWAGRRVEFVRPAEGSARALSVGGDRVPRLRAVRAEERPFDMEEVRYRNGPVTLAGLLMVPRVRKLVGRTGARLRKVPLPLPGAVVIHGSGDSDRDNIWAFTIAQGVAQAGVVVLLPDKRGSGASGGDWRTAGLDDLAADALAGVSFLAADPRVDSSRIGLVGLSQGGVVAPLAAVQSEGVEWVVSVSAAPIPLFQQIRHETTQDLKRAGLPEEAIEAITRVLALGIDYVHAMSDSTWGRYRTALATLAASPFGQAAAEFPTARDDWRWAWWAKVGDVDPLPAWRVVHRPVFALFGEEDEHDNVPVRESVARLADALHPESEPGNRIRVYPGMGHTLVDSTRGWVSRAVLDDLDAWILQTVGGLDPSMTSSPGE